jgi:hypothetical protein
MPAILNADYTVAEWVVVEPICGDDFCDSCGDCIACYGNDECPNGSHYWCVYADEVDEFRANHAPLATS